MVGEACLNSIQNDNKIILAGNGGSASMASHGTVDFTKQAGIRTVNFNESELITCFANDYGYVNWLAKAIELGIWLSLLVLVDHQKYGASCKVRKVTWVYCNNFDWL